MFGFGKKPDHYSDLLDHMIEEMGIKPRYAAAFLNAYRSTISTNLERGIKQTLRMIDGMPGGNLLYHQLPNQLTTAIAAQAYNSFLHDLRKGRHVGTDVELATWAILKTENDIFSQFDSALAAYIKANWRSKFPSLMEEVFSESCDFDNPLMIFCAGASEADIQAAAWAWFEQNPQMLKHATAIDAAAVDILANPGMMTIGDAIEEAVRRARLAGTLP
ncbi:hypothetical protein [Thermomonas sp.]|uniref:hypothetical protein n=1 Tax=Thermomonas sp. TaxID=1971895 RepID=UPI0035B4A090